jgi:hypothetical protein
MRCTQCPSLAMSHPWATIRDERYPPNTPPTVVARWMVLSSKLGYLRHPTRTYTKRSSPTLPWNWTPPRPYKAAAAQRYPYSVLAL